VTLTPPYRVDRRPKSLELASVGPFELDPSIGRGKIGYATVTSDQASITNATVTGLSVEVAVEAGRLLRVSHFTAELLGTAAGDVFEMKIQRGGSDVQKRAARFGVDQGTTGGVTSVLQTLAAGTYTFTAVVARASGVGSATHVASATSPAYLLVEDIGSA
jgi:hypothetical protein